MDAEVWNLNLDQIEAHGGRVLEKIYVEAEKLGPSTFPFEARTVLYSKLRPYLNKVVVADEAGFATTELVPLRCNPDEVHPEYLAYFLRSEEFLRFATEVVAGAKMPRMVMTAFWDFQIPLPPIAEQRRIAAILDQANVLRTKRREALAQLDNLTDAIFIQMFGDPVVNPNNFPMMSISEITDKGRALQLKSDTSVWNLNLDQIESNTGRIHEKVICRFEQLGSSTFLFKAGTVLYSKLRPYLNKVVIADEDGYATTELVPLRCKQDVVKPIFLAMFLRSKRFLDFANLTVAGAKMPRMVMDSFWSYELPVPDLALQNEFEKRIKETERQISIQRLSLVELDTLFASLQHRAFRGEL